MGTVPGMLNVTANIAPNKCATETVATLESVAYKDTFSEEEEMHAKLAEIDKLTWEHSAVSEVPREEATNNNITMTWIRTVKNGEFKYRLCCRPFSRSWVEQRVKDDLSCPTPSMATARILLKREAAKGHNIKLLDISRAFLHTPCKSNVSVEPPAEHNTSVPNMIWKLCKVVYGLEEAMVEFDS